MNIPNTTHLNTAGQKDFWDSLQAEILISNQQLTHDDIMSFIEQNFMFSLFFRGCSQLELISFQTILNIKKCGYLMLLELSPSDHIVDFEINTLALHHYLKKVLKNTNNTIGPFIINRIGILISDDSGFSGHSVKNESIMLGKTINDALHREFKVSTSIGIGSVQSIHTLYTSFIEALSCLQYSNPNQVHQIQNLKSNKKERQFDYIETEKHMLDSLRLRKTDAYNYFALIMEWIKPLSDDTKRNKILEILAKASDATQIDKQDKEKCFNFTGYLKDLLALKGESLTEWAYQIFISITGYPKPQTSINYSNRIVKATKEYLEAYYAEDISLEDAAEYVNISPQYFSKLIKKTTGFNFIDWLSMLRVTKAKELLSSSNITVKEVCFMVGYKDPNYFSRIFKKRIGITPSEFIKNRNN